MVLPKAKTWSSIIKLIDSISTCVYVVDPYEFVVGCSIVASGGTEQKAERTLLAHHERYSKRK